MLVLQFGRLEVVRGYECEIVADYGYYIGPNNRILYLLMMAGI